MAKNSNYSFSDANILQIIQTKIRNDILKTTKFNAIIRTETTKKKLSHTVVNFFYIFCNCKKGFCPFSSSLFME